MDTPIPVANKTFPFLGGCDSADNHDIIINFEQRRKFQNNYK